ncbi:major capsid protein [Humibacter sp. RRB41]|uniref:major capsid protein n=1 Tax=Humibacter sp. RRB41 TaxID=2919946 RepID=UPI001FAABA6B|nr:major capsid protein [Humibacter sp. RRB41]
MVYSSSFRTAAQLTAVARAAADATLASFVLPSYLPSVDNIGLSYDFDINSLQLTEAASFRAYDAESPFGKTPGGKSVQGKLPAISRKLRVSEYDQLTLFGQTDAIGGKFEDYAERNGAAIAARVALAQGQAVETGTITLNENGLIFTIDFARAAGNTVTAGTVWTTTSANALSDLTTWAAAYRAVTGVSPAIAMISSSVIAALQKNTSIIGAATGLASASLPAIISQDQVKAVFSSFGFGQIIINDDQIVYKGATQRIVGSNKLIWLPASGGPQLGGVGGVLGSTQWGIPAEAINSDYGISTAEAPGVFAAAFHDSDPEGHNVLASAIVLPVLQSANYTFAAQVI